jgi:hypothetical protein
MTSNYDHKSLTKVELLVLARTAPPGGASDDELATAVATFAPHEKQSGPEALAVLRRRSLVAPQTRKLTEAGRSTLCAALGVVEAPHWQAVKQTCLSMLGFATPARKAADPQRANRRDKIDARTLAMVQQHLEISNVKSLSALCDVLLAKALGLSGKVTLTALRARILAASLKVDAVRAAEMTQEEIANDFASRRHSDGNGKRSVQETPGLHGSERVATAWNIMSPSVVAANPLPRTPSSSNERPHAPLTIASSPRGPSSVTDADKLLNLVREAIPRIGSDGRFGPEKVFVSALWHYLENDGRLPDLSLDHFKRWLVTANRDQLVDLVRADSQGDMDGRLLEESEIRDLGATFHFVIDRQSATSRRGYHAR